MIVIVLPAYNEEQGIVRLLKRIELVAKTWFFDPVKVIVVDDGSSDHTSEKVQALNSAMIELVRHNSNRGLGEAIKTGMLQALAKCKDSDVIVTMDADNTHSPGLVLRMVLLIEEGYDVVIASRYQSGARVLGVPPNRRLFSRVMSWLFRILFPIPGVRDYSSGFRAYRAGLLLEAFNRWQDRFISQPGFACMVEILLKLRRLGAIMAEAPLVLRYDRRQGNSKMDVGKTIRQTLALAVRARLGN